MGLSQVTVNQIGLASGRPLPGFDHVSGLMLYGTAPVVAGKWKTHPGPPIVAYEQLFSAVDAITAGIVPFSDNVAAEGSYEITTPGASGDTLEITVDIPRPTGTETVSFGVYTVPASGSATAALQAVDYAALINAGTVTHGFTATVVGAEITIEAPTNLGVSLNSGTPIDDTIAGAFVATTTQFTNGTSSDYAIWEYHIREFFRMHPKGVLWVGIIAASSSFAEVKTLQLASSTKIRQIGVYDDNGTRGAAANIKGTTLLLHNALAAIITTAPMIAVYSPNISAVTNLSTYPDQNTNTAHLVRTVISQDGEAEGAQLYIHSGQTVGNIGACLGTLSGSRVSASDAQPIPQFNLSNGIENEVIAFGNGVKFKNVTATLVDQLADFNYTFMRGFADEMVGSYWSDNKHMVARSSSFANSNDNRVIQKVQRLLYTAYIPEMHSELYFNADGTLKDYTIEYLIDKGFDVVTNNMIIGFGSTPLISGIDIQIDPSQKIKITENLIVNVGILQNGIARNFTVNLAYTQSIPA